LISFKMVTDNKHIGQIYEKTYILELPLIDR